MKSAEVYVIANAGSIRVCRRTGGDTELGSEPSHLKEVPLDPSIKLPAKEDTIPSDRPGRFDSGGRAGSGNNLVHGERHGADQEWEKRQGRALAEAVEKTIAQQSPKSWALLAPGKWLPLIAEALSDETGRTLVATEAIDLTKHTLKNLEERFLSS